MRRDLKGLARARRKMALAVRSHRFWFDAKHETGRLHRTCRCDYCVQAYNRRKLPPVEVE